MVAIKTDQTQRQTLKKWMGAARFTYNACVDCLREHFCSITKEFLRATVVTKKSWLVINNPWLLETPSDIRDRVVLDFVTAYYTSRAKHGAGQFKMSFRSKKATTQTCYLAHRRYSKGVCYPSFWKKARLNPLKPQQGELSKWDGVQLPHDGLIVFRRPNLWFIQRIFTIPRGEIQVKGYVVALDPGVRTFQTAYDPVRESILEFGGGDSMTRLYRRCLVMDALQSKAFHATTTHRTRYHLLNKVLPQLRWKFKCLVEDLHRRTARLLCDNYDTIVLPSLPTSKLSERASRRLRSKTVRSMLGWSHYAFKRRLVQKAEETGSRVVIVTEEYTSQTCGVCGHIRGRFSSKTFACSQCGLKTDRDWNGSRNILVKTLSR
jgi:putative transposase